MYCLCFISEIMIIHVAIENLVHFLSFSGPFIHWECAKINFIQDLFSNSILHHPFSMEISEYHSYWCFFLNQNDHVTNSVYFHAEKSIISILVPNIAFRKDIILFCTHISNNKTLNLC